MNATVAAPVGKWTAGASGSWKIPSNWILGRAPIAGDDVDIESTSSIVITYDVGALNLGGLTLVGATLDLAGSGALTSAGPTTLRGALIIGSGPMTLSGVSTVSGLTVGGSVELINRGKVLQSGGALYFGYTSYSTDYVVNAQSAIWSISDASGMYRNYGTGVAFYKTLFVMLIPDNWRSSPVSRPSSRRLSRKRRAADARQLNAREVLVRAHGALAGVDRARNAGHEAWKRARISIALQCHEIGVAAVENSAITIV